jgi:hypothetical protein
MKAILAFVATAYALSIALSLVVGLTGGHESRFIGLAYLSMVLPAVSVLIINSTMKEAPRLRWDQLPLKYLPVAMFLIPGVLHAVALPLLAASGGIQWQDWLTPQADGLYHAPGFPGLGRADRPRTGGTHPPQRSRRFGGQFLHGVFRGSRLASMATPPALGSDGCS